MVIISGKEPKRKRKQLPIEPAISIETPKRTKVQAQRKFAQGQGNPSSSLVSAVVPGSSSNNSKDVIVTEPIMATPPPAKDFLTYVCFQRSPVFQSLNYLGKSTATATSPGPSTSPAKSPAKRVSRGEDSAEEDHKPRAGRKTKHVEAKPYAPVTSPAAAAKSTKAEANSDKTSPPAKRKPGRPPKVSETPVASPPASSAPKSESEYETASENESEKEVIDPKKVSKESATPSREEVPAAAPAEPKEERITRHMAWRHSYNNTPIEPTIKRIKKTPVASPTPAEGKAKEKAPTPVTGKKKPETNAKKTAAKKEEEEENSEFSSDDDKPLVIAKSTGKSTPQPKGKRNSNHKSLVKEEATKKTGKNKRKSSPVAESSSSTPSTPPKKTKNAKISKAAQNKRNNAKEQQQKKKGTGKKKSQSEEDDEEDQSDSASESPKPRADSKQKRKYLSKELEKLTADISQTPTDFSENETKTNSNARPTRKTKEAATIYMELIGHKLNLNDTDDDGAASMDSYPELPNVKKTQQLEEELRQSLANNKVERRGRKKKKPAEEEKESGKVEDEAEKKVNKSFSDSDEEPLATKVVQQQKKVKKTQEVSGKSPSKQVPIQEESPAKKRVEPPKRSPVKLTDAEDVLNFSMNSFKSPVSNYDRYSVAISTPMSTGAQNPLNLSQKSPGWVANEQQQQKTSPTEGEFLRPANKAKPRMLDPPISPIVDDTSPQNIASLMMMNPLPSKEESGKIFGIASVTLAQSSGPQDTKCTLGKCGSIHNQSLGPAVPTEALLGEVVGGGKDRRKSKVNMTQEQIQKWLIDCAAVGEKEIIPDDLADLDLSVTPKPSTTIVDSPMEEGSPSITMRKCEAPRPAPVTITSAAQPITKAKNLIEKFDEDKDAVSCEVEQSVNQIIQKLNFEEDLSGSKGERSSPAQLEAKEKGKKKTPAQGTKAEEKRKSPTTPTSGDRKPIYNRRTPVYNKVTPDSPKETPKTLTKQSSFSAFSPENEPSVYDFDREGDEVTPMKPPFRRQSKGAGDSPRVANRGRKTSSLSPQKPVTSESSPQVSVALHPSTSVALQIGLPKEKEKKGRGAQKAKAVDSNDSDSEGPTIYIPLQKAGVGKAGKSDQLIQGVSVKLGTEGPDGCVIMKAKLVTKSVTAVGGSGAAITDAKTQELMKSIITGKEGSNAGGSGGSSGGKPVPVGTVQPRFKSNEATAGGSKSGGQLMRCGSNSSLASQKSVLNRKSFDTTPIQPTNNTAFPRIDDPAQMVEAPVFRPTEKEFQDPMEFIERIMPIAARFGLCRIIPPSSFKPECRVSDEMRFMAYNQYVHKMLHRWGPSAKELWAIKKYLATQSIQLNQPPLIGGMEVDLPRLYHTVQELGGLKEVIEKKKWAKVAEEMCIPKTAQDRVSKLDDIYCKFLLPYDTLSPAERQKLFDEVEADWAKREAKARRNAMRKIEPSEDGEEGEEENRSEEEEESEDEENDEDEDNLMECIVKGRSMALNAFYRVARNTMQLWFKNTEPQPAEVESEFWRHVAVRDSHVCVHSGSIDSSGWGYGFPAPGGNKAKGTSACAKHPWNLKVLTNNSGSVLRSLGPVMGVTVPTLHVGMLFSACCWYRDPHGLPWIEYLHTGGSKIWYGVPDEQSNNFRTALTELVPTHCQNKTIWLPCDTAMVPPHILTEKGVSLCRTEQQPGQFVIIFPRAYTSSVATGYVVSESVYFATNQWLDMAHEDFKDIQESREPTMFSLDQLIFAIAADQRCNVETLNQVEPMIKAVLEKEKTLRSSIKAFGVVIESRKKANAAAASASSKKGASSTTVAIPDEEIECDLCRTNLFISMVRTETEDEVAYYCLQHGLMYLKKGELQAKESKLIYNHELDEIEALTRKLKERVKSLQQQQQKAKAK